ncbi:hypothetical protein [Falsiroseomonas sp. HW251]|uniref:hypothetical protein n=1 Tax=Falsiroseomonas sp. HW251 TaxID=3390998 RepID=UPI003D317963
MLLVAAQDLDEGADRLGGILEAREAELRRPGLLFGPFSPAQLFSRSPKGALPGSKLTGA